MMRVNSYQINEKSQLKPLSSDRIVETYHQPDSKIWLDLEASNSGELEQWLDKFEFTGFSRRLCREARDRPGFYPLNQEIFLVIPVHVGPEDKLQLEYLALFCNENLLLTIHDSPVPKLPQPQLLEGANEWLPERSIAGLVAAMMIDLSIVSLQHVSDLRKSILTLEERMDRTPDTVNAEEIMELRSELETLEMVVSDQLPVVEALSATDRPFFKLKEEREYMSCSLTNMQAADRSLGRLDQRIDALRFAFQMHAQEKTNQRLGMLTILSAIFMPITLLAGIWGMNFQHMPELGYPFAYPIALGLMIMIGLGMYFLFRRAGWFD